MIKEHRSGDWSPGLTREERETLFAIAEDTLAWCVAGKKDRMPLEDVALTPKLREPTATFVTLKMDGRLRGCIGSLAPVAPLYQSVHDNAVNASMRDGRFRPLTPPELARTEVQISILSPMRAIESLDEFTVGAHGIIVEKGRHCAVYLPEVAPEQGWTKEQTLASLSQKAGMDADGWRTGARFKVFSSVALSRE